MLKPAITSLSRLRPILPTQFIETSKSSTVEAPVKKRPGTPFFRDDRHRRPTRALYRHLLRSTKSKSSPLTSVGNAIDADTNESLDGLQKEVDWNALRSWIKEQWRKRKGMTSIPRTLEFLESQYTHLTTLQSHPPYSPSLVNLSHHLASRQAQAIERSISQPPPLRPYLAGFLRPTYHHPPLPRLKPQPVRLSLMIKTRVNARERRIGYQKHLWEIEEFMKGEIDFSRRVRDREGLDDSKAYLEGVRIAQKELQGRFDRDMSRKGGVYGLGLVRRVEKAKRARQEFKRNRAEQLNKLKHFDEGHRTIEA